MSDTGPLFVTKSGHKEMEAAAFFTVSHYYNIPLAQLLYKGDDVSGDDWDSRNECPREYTI